MAKEMGLNPKNLIKNIPNKKPIMESTSSYLDTGYARNSICLRKAQGNNYEILECCRSSGLS